MSPDFDAFVISPSEVIKSEPLLGRGEVTVFDTNLISLRKDCKIIC